MIFLTIFFSLITQAADFSSFTYCKENSRGLYESQCVQLDASARGEVRFKRRDADPESVQIQLSPGAKDRFISVLSTLNYLEDAADYESHRKVADLGRKHLILETPSGKRETTYNFSDRKAVMDLTAFFDSLINQEAIGFDMNTAIQFERLSVPKRLDQIENELRANRIGDPQRLVPLLEKIESDQRLVNYVRTKAGKMKQEIQAGK